MITDWRILDIRCTIGRHVRLREGYPHSAADLLNDMDHVGVAEAMVLDCLSQENHPAEGNARVLKTTAGHPRLHPLWAALSPGAPEEQPGGPELLAAMHKHRVAALMLLPNQFKYSLHDWCIDELLEPLAAHRVPVIVCYDEVGGSNCDRTDWPQVVAMAKRWPTLPILVSEWRIRRSQRILYRALEACQNLRIELSGYSLYRGIEYITRRWGAGRLVFGSYWPAYGQPQTLCTLLRAEIDDDAKRLIAGDNMRKLMAWCDVEHPRVPPVEPADEYVAIGRGQPVRPELRFMDCHGHIGGHCLHYHVPDGELDATVSEMDRQGVQEALVFSLAGVFGDEQYGNDLIAEAVRRYPQRFLGFTLVNPNHGRDAMLAELARGQAMGLRGVKLHAFGQHAPERGELIELACRWAHEHRQFILNHNWGPPDWLEPLLAKYTDACFICGHATRMYSDLMTRWANVYVCSCPLWDGPRDCEMTVAAIGADRLLFGSDLQDLPIAWGTGPILYARIPPEQKRLILGENLRRLMQRYSLAESS
jgi:predicted TIM-barrel fold metal-dependent hydrolase